MTSARPETGHLLETLLRLAAQAGRLALEMRSRLGEIARKADHSPVTEADLAVDAMIHAGLSNVWPDIPVVSEERAASQSAEPPERYFLVDPIDGTKEYIRSGGGEFTVNIALIEGGEAVAGVIGAPAAGRLFAGARGEGAFETSDRLEAPRRLTPRKPDNDALIVVASRSHMTDRTREFIAANKVARTCRAGSSLKFCLLAAGEADLYPRFGPTMEWDTAAGHAILAAAGGFVEEISGAPLKYGKPNYGNGAFIAYTPGTKFVVPEWLRK